MLLEAKKLILERLVEIRKQLQINNLEQLIFRVSDNSVQERLLLELNNLNAQISLWRGKFEELEEKQSREISKLKLSSDVNIDELRLNLNLIKRERAVYRVLLGLVIGFSGILSILYLPGLMNWQWLLSHPKKIPIQVSLCLIILSLSWSIADSNNNRRWFAFGSIAIAASLGLLGLL
jgi:hypothetical protein